MVIFNTEQKIIAAITLLILQLFTYSASSNGSETNLKYVKAENIGLVCKFDIVRMRTVSEVENTFTFDAILTVRSFHKIAFWIESFLVSQVFLLIIPRNI